MDIDIVLGTDIDPSMLNVTHVTNKKSLTLTKKPLTLTVNNKFET
jgi:hypothetical protein